MVIVCGWIFVIFFEIFLMIVMIYDKNYLLCFENWFKFVYGKIYIVFIFVVDFLVFFVLMVVLYVKIVKIFWGLFIILGILLVVIKLCK